MSEWPRTLLAALLDSSLRISLIAASVAVILAACRARSNGVRHAAWTAVLVVMLFIPVLPYGVPPISVSLPTRLVPRPSTLVGTPDHRVETPPDNVLAPAPTESGVRQLMDTGVPVTPNSTLPTIGAVVYGTGVFILLFRLIVGWLAMIRIGRESSHILPERDAPVYESQRVVTPMTIGVFSAKVILPATWKTWPDEKLRAVLAHETAHIQRRDPLVSFLARANCSLFWFHPLAWWLKRKLASSAEHACDDAAVLAVGQPQQYAEILLDMAQTVRRREDAFCGKASESAVMDFSAKGSTVSSAKNLCPTFQPFEKRLSE